MTKALFLIGSPRGKKSTSFSFGDYLEKGLLEKDFETNVLIVRSQLASEEKTSQMLSEISESNVVILTAPLYDDCQPYIVIKLMELIAAKKMNLDGKRFIPIINCAFGETVHITATAIPIYHKFADAVGFRWGGSLAIPGGEMFQGKTGKPLADIGKLANKMMKTLDDLADAISLGKDLSDMAPKVFPGFLNWKFLKKLFGKMSTRGWRKAAADKGEDPDAKPYLD